MKVQIPVTFDSANRRKDRSVRLSFTTNLEVETSDYVEMDRLIQQSGWLLFSPNELSEADVPKDEAPSDTKKPSVRLRGVLWHLWDQHTDKSEPFDIYYQRQMERIIQQLRERLES